MPRFHFPIVNGHRLEDPVGIELTDSDAARSHAETIARHVGDVGNKTPRNVIVEDEHGDQLAKAAVKRDPPR
jgi:hypothetical protein